MYICMYMYIYTPHIYIHHIYTYIYIHMHTRTKNDTHLHSIWPGDLLYEFRKCLRMPYTRVLEKTSICTHTHIDITPVNNGEDLDSLGLGHNSRHEAFVFEKTQILDHVNCAATVTLTAQLRMQDICILLIQLL
jgi:hypothetical protein